MKTTQAPPKDHTVLLGPDQGLLDLDLGELWQNRELLVFLLWRDIKVRYKQTALGIGWAVLQPFMTMVIFTAVFGLFAQIPTGGIPYPLFSYTAILPWDFFSQGVSRGSLSLVDSSQLITKVYFPRLVLPIASAIAPLVDFALAFVFLLVLMAWYGVAPTWRVLLLPVFLLLAFLTSLSVSLWLSAINVRYRDVRHAVPFLLQFWMYASPVAYPIEVVPVQLRPLYSLNPMAGVIEGFRWALLNTPSPNFGIMAISAAVVAILLAGGVIFFKRMESTFADVI